MENNPDIITTPTVTQAQKFKPPISHNFLFILYSILSTSGIIYLYSQNQSLNKQLVYIKNTPSLSPSYIYTDSPSPTPSPISYPIITSRQQVEFKTAKQLDDPLLHETYLISFDKVTPSSAYKITNDQLATLIIFDDSYEFSLQIPLEGFSNSFKTIPPTDTINTQHLGKLTRVTNPYHYSAINPISPSGNKTEYHYTTDFDTNCSQWSPVPAACSFLQVTSNNNVNPNNKINSSLICKTTEATPTLCDKLISTLEIKLK